MKRRLLIASLLVFLGLQFSFAQRQISGKVTSAEDGSPLPGVTVAVKGTQIGTLTDLDGKYTLSVPSSATTLVFSYIGMKAEEVEIGAKTVIDIVLQSSTTQIEGVVVTALAIPREKKSLGYATQELKGDNVSAVKTDNVLNSLSGKVSGVQVRKTTNMGGSTNILLRGSKSLTGDNQVLFVVDGVPISNDNTNSNSQRQAGLGFDYGNAASDINPDDIESINVLKGSAATALYGSRAANGVIMITTKKGKIPSTLVVKKGIGVTINSGVTVGFVDKKTFPEYQKDYGGGYGHYYAGPDAYWNMLDFNGDGVEEQWVVTSEDASYGAPFDPNLMVYQWNAVDPETPNYFKATPWVAAENGPITFFENPVTITNSIAIDNSFTGGSFRMSYTNYNQQGILPNSELKKNNFLFNGSYNVTDRLTASVGANYIKQNALGRNSTGYSDNIMGSFRQWYQTNVDIKEQKELFDLTGRNITWNWSDPTDPVPIYWDNYYWTRYKNYESDGRDRFIGNMSLNYKINDWLNVMGRVATDFYNELQEERRAIGSVATPFGIGTGADGSTGRSDQQSGYLRRDITFSEFNYDLMLNFNKNLTKNWNLKGVLGTNIRRTNYNRMISSTNGGLGIPELYSLQNSVGALPFPKELASKVGVDGIYGSASFGYKDYLYIDGTLRRDHSSTLPVDNSIYYYPSVATSFIFSNFIPKNEWLSFGKVRLNYAQVGNSAGFDQLTDNYTVLYPFSSPTISVSGTKKAPELKPEKTNSLEGGLEMFFFGRRLGFDLALYKTNTVDQILPIALSTATGYTYRMVNAGEIQNKGIELAIMGTPIKMKDFKWEVTLNWARNVNEVISLMEGLDNLQLGSFQGGITLNARVGEPYGVLCGTDYTYLNGYRVVSASSGQFIKTGTSDQVIGNVNPDWTGGIYNTFTYKNWSLGFLVDIQKGGDIFSLDMYYGLASGLYKETSFTNDLGNPVRNTNADGGGFINQGVNPNGNWNQTRIRADRYGAQGYARGLPDIAFVYDATYVKLREVAVSYTLPSKILEKYFITGATFSLVGSNVWIIYKNLPYADPESGLGAGNLQGFSTGSLPSTRDFGLNVKLTF